MVDKGIQDTISGIRKPITTGTISLDPKYIVQPLNAKVEDLTDIHPSTLRAVLRYHGVYVTKRKGSPQSYNLNADL